MPINDHNQGFSADLYNILSITGTAVKCLMVLHSAAVNFHIDGVTYMCYLGQKIVSES